MKIAIDFDSVLSDTMVSWVEKFNKKHGTNYTKNDVRQWAFWKDFGITHDRAKEFFRESWEDWESLRPTEPELSITVEELSKIVDVDIVSNVETTHRKYVEKWLEKNEINYQQFVSSNKKEDLQYNVFIDDDPVLAEKLRHGKKNCFVYHQQWNAHISHGNYVTRIRDLKEAHERIKKKKF